MAYNLLKSGHIVKVFDLSNEAIESVVDKGALVANSLSDAVTGVDFVITMLPTGKEVRDIFMASQLLHKARHGTLFIDCSTIDVESSLAVHATVKKAGFGMIDAPVSGGTVGAENGSLTFMCGGQKEIFEKCQKIFGGMGKNVVHCGGPSQGQVVKICNNMVAGTIFLATAEAFVLGEKLGVERETIFNVLSTSSGNSWVLENACPLPGGKPGSSGSKEFKPGFSAQLMLKDLLN